MQKKIVVSVDRLLPELALSVSSGESATRTLFGEEKAITITVIDGDLLTIEGVGFVGIGMQILDMGENMAGLALELENKDYDQTIFGKLFQGGKDYKNVSVFELNNRSNSVKSNETGKYSLRLTGAQPFGIGYQGMQESKVQLVITTKNNGGKVDVLFDDTNTIGSIW